MRKAEGYVFRMCARRVIHKWGGYDKNGFAVDVFKFHGVVFKFGSQVFRIKGKFKGRRGGGFL